MNLDIIIHVFKTILSDGKQVFTEVEFENNHSRDHTTLRGMATMISYRAKKDTFPPNYLINFELPYSVKVRKNGEVMARHKTLTQTEQELFLLDLFDSSQPE